MQRNVQQVLRGVQLLRKSMIVDKHFVLRERTLVQTQILIIDPLVLDPIGLVNKVDFS